VAHRPKGLRQVALAAGPKVADILVLPYVRRDGLRLWQACYGIFPNRSLAAEAWQAAPESLRRTFKDAFPQTLPAPTPAKAEFSAATRE
jgi:hypothetical protein